MGGKKTAGRGQVVVITGNGEGEINAAFGRAIRAAEQGLKVFIVQFPKMTKYGKNLPGLDNFIMRNKPAAEDMECARQGLESARKAVQSGHYNMVILDEINAAIDFRLIALKEVVEFISNRPADIDLILTGSTAPPEIVELADTVVQKYLEEEGKQRPVVLS